jgi:hypothetical protein
VQAVAAKQCQIAAEGRVDVDKRHALRHSQCPHLIVEWRDKTRVRSSRAARVPRRDGGKHNLQATALRAIDHLAKTGGNSLE